MDGQQANGADFMVQSQTASPPGGGGAGGGSNGDAAAVAAAATVAGGAVAAANAATANGGINNNSEAKRAKLDTMKQNNPSRVIHIRNIPNDVTEAEIIHLGIPFGRVTNVLVLKGKNQVGTLIENKVARWQNLIPSFPWIAPGWRVGGAIQGKEGIKFCSVA